jgi:PAS domain S-box-containing protein
MRIAIENAAAERGVLILFRGDEPWIEAEATTGGGTVAVTPRAAPVSASELPESVLHHAIRTREAVIRNDGSVLCLPLVKQATLIGVLYLENGPASNPFAPGRISALNVIASQAAISLENARLYGEAINENRDRRNVDDALRASEARWRNLFENVPVGIVLAGLQGRIVAANPAFQRMLGYSEAELRSRTVADITYEDDRTATTAFIASLTAGEANGPPPLEKRYRCKNGALIWAEVSAIEIPLAESTPLLAAVAVDITDRKRAEEDLRRSEAFLSEAQRISHTGSWRWNVDTDEFSWSVEHYRIFAFDPASTQPSFAAVMERVHPEDRSALDYALDRAVRERIPFQHEFRIVLPDGSLKHLQSTGLPDVAESGDLEFVGTVIDLTERKRTEDALRASQAELARVARLTTMGEMVASIAHEINQPLAAIVANAQAAARWLNHDPPDLAETRGLIETIVKNGSRAGNVIRGIRALSSKSGSQLTSVDINDLIEEVLALSRSDLQRDGVLLHAELSHEIRPAFGDKVQLQQVVLNLLTNALEAMSAVTERPKALAVSTEPLEAGGVLVAIEDNGTGLEPATADRVFDSFFTTKPGGMGMGLSICRSIVEAHGGRLWMSPRVPHGTAVRFTVPTAENERRLADSAR